MSVLCKYLEDLISIYQNSPCTNKRSSSFKLGINPIRKEIEHIWSDWSNCPDQEDETSRSRKKIFQHIRNFLFLKKSSY